jgi:hypothetical protein
MPQTRLCRSLVVYVAVVALVVGPILVGILGDDDLQIRDAEAVTQESGTQLSVESGCSHGRRKPAKCTTYAKD